MKKITNILAIIVLGIWMTSCDVAETPTPTKTLMQGNWQLIEASDTSGDILNKIAFPVTCFQLTDDNGMVGTQAPMFTRIVYGPSKWIEVSSKFGQVWDYLNFNFSTGEYFVGNDVQPRFTVEAKLKATAAAGGSVFVDILQTFGVNTSWLDQTIYHKFQNVKVDFSENNQVMTWTFDDEVVGLYNTKNSQGNYILWQGWPVEKFQRSQFVFRKKTQGINDIVNSYK